MKNIQNVTVWNNGVQKIANKLSVIISFDDLDASAKFSYNLIETIEHNIVDIDGNQTIQYEYDIIANGDVPIGGEDYQNWDDSNDAAYNFVASKINVILV